MLGSDSLGSRANTRSFQSLGEGKRGRLGQAISICCADRRFRFVGYVYGQVTRKAPCPANLSLLASGRMTGLSGLYLLGPPATVFASSVMATRQADRTAPCSAHLLIWRRGWRHGCPGCIYGKPWPAFSPRQSVARGLAPERPCLTGMRSFPELSETLASQIRRSGKARPKPRRTISRSNGPRSIDADKQT